MKVRTFYPAVPQSVLDVRRDLCTAHVTLDGVPAKIAGAALPYATVATLDGHVTSTWNWNTVKRIVERDGHFKI